MYIHGLTSHATSTRARTSASLPRNLKDATDSDTRERRTSQTDTQTSVDACSEPRKQ